MIHTFGQHTTNHLCNAFYVTNVAETWTFLESEYAIKYKSSVERGWFRDIAVFTQICKSQPVIDPKSWPFAVLATIERDYKDLWLGFHYNTLFDDAPSGNEEPFVM